MQVHRLRRQLLRLFITSDTNSAGFFCESVKVIQAAMRLKTRLKHKVQQGNQQTVITSLHDAFQCFLAPVLLFTNCFWCVCDIRLKMETYSVLATGSGSVVKSRLYVGLPVVKKRNNNFCVCQCCGERVIRITCFRNANKLPSWIEGLYCPPAHSAGSYYKSTLRRRDVKVSSSSSSGMPLSLAFFQGATECACHYPHRHLLTGCWRAL